MNVETIILRDAIPDNAKIIDSRFRDYRLRFNDEIIIHSSPSTGPFGLYENDVFYQFEKEPKPDQQIRQPNFVDPWIMIKSIPNAKIVNKNTIISQENMILIGLQYHYVTPLVKPENMSHVEIDHYLNSNSKPEIFVPVAKETETLSEVFFLGGTDNFGHWIFEFLPKLIWYKKYLFNLGSHIPILVGDDVPDRWLESGEALGIPKENFLRVNLGKTFNVEKLYICGASVSKDIKEEFNQVRIDDISELRVVYRNYYKLNLLPKSTDVLIETRQNARWRKIQNEQFILQRMEKELNLKVEKFIPEQMSFKEQLEKIQSTKMFIGTGASLPISYFMSKDSVLCEVRHTTGRGMATNIGSRIFRIPYYRPATTVTETNTGSNIMDADLIIDEDDFFKKMEFLVKNYFLKI